MSKSALETRWMASPPFRYGLAVLSVAISTSVTLLLQGYTFRTAFFFPAILLSTWYGGIRPGLLSVVLSILSINYFFLGPKSTLEFIVHDIPLSVSFLFSALLISLWSAARNRAEEGLRRSRSELEAKVQERTSDFEQSNEQLQSEIAERERAGQVLRERADLLDLTHDTVFVRDMNDVITYWNRGAEELYGWPRNEAVGQVTHALMQTIFPAPLEKINEELLGAGRWEGELVQTKRDGTQVVVASRWSLQRDEHGRPRAILETNNDVTQRKRAEEERRYQTQLLQTVTNNASSMLYIADTAGLGTFVNPSLERITGYRAEEVIGHVVHDTIHHTKPDGKPYPVGECPISGALRTGRTVRGEDFYVRKDGTFFPIRYIASPILRNGEAVGTVVEIQDLTEPKAAEEELRKQAELLSLAHDAIIVRDPENRITFWNQGAEKTYGWTAAEAIGRITHELLNTRFPVSLQALEAALQEQGEWEGELTHITRPGTAIVVTSRQSLRRDEHGAPAAILEINRDVTERKQAEVEIRKLNEELEQRVIERTVELEAVNKELETFAYSVSHDLRAPLRHMAGFAELLQKNASSILDEKSRRYMTMILESAKRMGILIDDLLAFSRVGRAEIQKTVVSLEQVVSEALSEVRQEADGRNIVWRTSALPDVRGDRSMLRLAFVNLISNAVKFTRTRPQAEIEIGADAKEAEIVVFIRDNGVGFDMNYVNRLFGVFQRLHRTEEFEGTGIGLATVQRVVHRHGGRVWAEGVQDQGATFYFTIPKS
jgi:PAS domain S-box-containing protein